MRENSNCKKSDQEKRSLACPNCLKMACQTSIDSFDIAGTALLVLRGAPGVRGLTIDTAVETNENPIIDEWATSDVIIKSGAKISAFEKF